MKENKNNLLVYEPPLISILKIEELLGELAPAVSCSGYGGSVSGC